MRKYIVFRLGSMEFGIEIDKVSEILKAREPRVLPAVEDFISGVITLRGEVVPLVDMRKRLGIESVPAKQRTVLVRAGGDRVGLIVDEVIGIRGFDPEDISRPAVIVRGLREEYLEGIGRENETVIILLNIDAILTAEELILVREAAEQAAQ